MGKKRILISLLCAAMTISLTACGKQNAQTNAGNEKEHIYVPEYYALDNEQENTYIGTIHVEGDSVYYSQTTFDVETEHSSDSIFEYTLADGVVSQISLEAENERSLSGYALDTNGDIYTVWYNYSSERTNDEGFHMPDVYIAKFDKQGSMLFEKDITKVVSLAGENAYIQDIVVDGENNIYVCAESAVLLFNSDGEEQGMVEVSEGWIYSIGLGKDGKAYVCYYDQTSATGGMAISEIDFKGKKVANTYRNLPNMSSNGFSVGVEKDFLVNDGTKLYEYDLSSQSYEEVLTWLDCDINGSYVVCVSAMEDGNLLAVITDWDTGVTEIAKLVKTAIADAVQKEEIVIGTLYESQELQAAAVAFNKESEKYHVTIKTYIDMNNWTETSYQDAITNLNNEITSGANCPDILDLSQLNEQQLAAKGVLEDLNPYLEQSNKYSKEDFVDGILEGYTYENILTSIPTTFNINTIVGKSSELGTEMGWSLEEMVAFAKEHPDAQLFDGVTQATMMQYCLMYNQDSFVDWSKGECYFDSDEFRTLLEFVGMFPVEIDWETFEGGMKVEERQAGEILLENAYISEFQDVQIYPAIYGEDVTFIGFPTTDGSVGCAMEAGTRYGITTKSAQKEGAWAFIESYLDYSKDSMYIWGFSTLKDRLQQQIDECMQAQDGASSIGWEDWEYTYHTPTQEEVDLVKELIAIAKPGSNIANDEIMVIINEEAEAYFQGQKTIDEVVSIIQSRAQIYISENS